MPTQVVANGVIAASAYALIGVSFALIYRVARFFHIAHGVIFTAGAYCVFLCQVFLGLPLAVCIPLAAFSCASFGAVTELMLFAPLRRRGASPAILLLASLGTYVVMQNLISLLFGNDMKALRVGPPTEGVPILGARVTPVQLATLCTALLLVLAVAGVLRCTDTGRAVRAVADDAELAKAAGVDSDRVILWTFAVASALVGVAGVLVAMDVGMTPTMGLAALMMGVVAAIVGGVGSVGGVALGALVLGMAQHLGAWKTAAQWQDTIAFGLLLLFLLVRPQGVLGRPLRKVTV
jgi:branched-chain amino acid transport system permease protein